MILFPSPFIILSVCIQAFRSSPFVVSKELGREEKASRIKAEEGIVD